MLFRVSPSGPFSNIPLGGSLEVATIAALAALPDDSDTPDLIWVRTVLCYWHRNRASTLGADGITVVAALGGGNWERIVPTTAPDWLSQAAWTVDPILGNDENAGGAAAPLRAFAELERRLSTGAIRQPVIATIPAAATVPAIELNIATGPYRFDVVGIAAVLAAGTVTTFTERTHAGATPQGALLTDAAIADWTPYVGSRLRLTSGANAGAIAWVAKANPNGIGLNVARISRFCAAPSSSGATGPVVTVANPAPGDQYVIESLPVVGALSLRQRDDDENLTTGPLVVSLGVANIELPSAPRACFGIYPAQVRASSVDGCKVVAVALNVAPRSTVAEGQVFSRSWVKTSFWNGGAANFVGCVFFGTCITSMSMLRCRYHLSQWDSLSAAGGFAQGATASVVSQAFLQDVQIFDFTKAGINLQNAVTWYTREGLSGQGNAVGLIAGDDDNEAMAPQFFTWCQTADIPNLLGTTEVKINAATGDIDLTWATIVAEGGFSSDEQRGTAALAAGTKTVTGIRNANVRHPVVTRDTPGGTLGTDLVVPVAGCTATQFRIDSVDTAGAVVVTDVSTVFWLIPAMRRQVMICQANGKT